MRQGESRRKFQNKSVHEINREVWRIREKQQMKHREIMDNTQESIFEDSQQQRKKENEVCAVKR